MPPKFEDDYGFDSADEADLIALADAPSQTLTLKRKASFNDDGLPPKRPATSSPQAHSFAIEALTRNFALKAFRLKQEQVISRILGGGSAVVVFPTGGGKSLCYQIPALCFSELDKVANSRGEGEGGITLVVSPLIALMKDQVDALVRRGIKARVLDSTKSREQYLETCDLLRNGELKLLYCAPERLNNEGFVQQMKNVRGGIRLLAVDEAHCISEWGHAFRPDYLKISRFVKEIQAERVICLTATATPRVAKDVCNAFDIDEGGIFRTSTYRPNLRLLAQTALTKKQLYPHLFSFLRENLGPSIVYVTLQKQTELLAQDLRNLGFKAEAFHAGLATAVKTQLQEKFMKVNDLIIVATIAFGMGIDKPDIRNVVHFNIPNSLESYSQEIGRAGRDGKVSNCMFYVCGEDLHLRELFARGDLPSRNSIRDLLKEIFNSSTVQLPVGGEFKVSHSNQERDFDIRSTALKGIYAQLEISHHLIRASTPVYTNYSFKAGSSYKLMLASDNSPPAKVISAFARKAASLYHMDVDKAATSLGVPRFDIINKLNDWNESQVLELKVAGVLNVYKIEKALPKTEVEIERLAKDIYSKMEKREQEALDRTEEMLHLITKKACYSRTLAQHFGDDLPDGKTVCGHCTWCLTHKALAIVKPPPVKLCYPAFKAILDKVPARDDARLLARIAFGITSPRISYGLKLSKDPVFASMQDHAFMDLLNAFTGVCSKDNQKII